MKIKGAVFDADGTLLDSMPVWMELGDRYLKNLGIDPEKGLGDKLFAMTMEEGAAYLKESCKLDKEIAEIIDEINSIIKNYYFLEVPLKPGAAELLEWMKSAGIKASVATATDKELICGAFDRLGITPYFTEIFTCTQVGAGKENPLIYRTAARCMGTKEEETCVLEDALHGLLTAKKAGFYTIGVYDKASAAQQEQLKLAADLYGKNFLEILEKIKNI